MEGLAPATPSPGREGRGHIQTPSQRLDDALHALAQLPDDLGLEIGCGEEDLGRLRLLARAYGDDARVSLRPASTAHAAWVSGSERIPYDPLQTLAETVEGMWSPEEGMWSAHGDDEILAGHRVTVVSNLPTHYRLPLFAGMSRRLEAVGGSLRVLFLRSSAGRRTWLDSRDPLDFAHDYIHGFDVPVRRRPPRVPLGLGGALRRHRPTIALSAGLSPTVSGIVLRYARRAGIPFGLWSGEIPRIANEQPGVRKRQRRRLVRGADFAIAYGSLAAQYLAQQAPGLPVTLARNTSVLETGARRADAVPVELVTVGDMASPRKGVDVLVRALRAIPQADCRLTVIGDGRLRAQLERDAASDDRIQFAGALPSASVAARYAASDVFLFPSRSDVFGLVLVEAMSCGLPSVVSSSVGAVPDLAVSGHNSLVLGTHEPSSWAEAIARLVEDRQLRSALGGSARRTIARRWTIDHAVEGSLAGLRLAAHLAADGPAR